MVTPTGVHVHHTRITPAGLCVGTVDPALRLSRQLALPRINPSLPAVEQS